ncbi:hypothetical protein [Natronoglomus mannanivorans]|uniref:Uncharacterized protein n=1 Tax=Natronoglomus mannanivorans TaxID=2979990 RepID=A0AAP3DZZ5_9EURY|nr:hypothetical protein [Halobacteria archaeon AArc-xg1-1]
MKESVVVGASLLLAILTAGTVGLLTDSYATAFAGTPVGFAVYLVVGIGLPQYLLSRDGDSATRLGLAALSVVAGVLVVLASVVLPSASPTAEWGAGFVLLFLVVVGNVLGATVRAFRDGYRTSG